MAEELPWEGNTLHLFLMCEHLRLDGYAHWWWQKKVTIFVLLPVQMGQVIKIVHSYHLNLLLNVQISVSIQINWDPCKYTLYQIIDFLQGISIGIP